MIIIKKKWERRINMDQAKEMAKIAFEALEDKKGEDECAIDITAVS